MKTFWLVDGSSIAYRSHFAFIHNPLRNSKGQNTSAVFGFINSLLKLLSDKSPEYMCIAFDAPGPTFRHEQFKEYKITRPPTPSELPPQLSIIKNIVKVLGIKCIEKLGVEADDVIGTIAVTAKKEEFQVIIFADDKDFLQLESQEIEILSPKTFELIHCQEKLGISSTLIPDYLALTGDAVDNIPGVKGIGPKTAHKLLTELGGGLDTIYAKISEIESEKLRDTLVSSKEAAYFSKMLATIKTDVEIEDEISNMKVGQIDKEGLFPILRELEFYSIIKKLLPSSSSSQADESVATPARSDTISIDFKAVSVESDLDNFLSSVDKQDLPSGSQVSMVFKEQYFALSTGEATGVFKDELSKLITIMKSESIEKIVLDSKFLFHHFDVKGKVFDIGLAGYLLDPSLKEPSVEAMAIKWLGKSLPGSVDTEILGNSSQVCSALYPILKKELHNKGLDTIYNDVELPLANVLAEMEKVGVLIDKNYFSEEAKRLDVKINKIEESIYEEVGERFNLRSPSQLSHILFDKLNLPKSKHKKTHYSTEQEVLAELALVHPVPKKILEYRELFKLKSTYIDTIPTLADKNNRVHTRWQQTGTITGRLSSVNPNLQNIPNREIGKGFIAPDGYVIMDADYSQIELRILAGISKDSTLLESFNQEEDIHKKTAALIFHTPEKQVTTQQRNMAKVVNFGVIYGMGPYGLAQRLNIKPKEALEFITSYFLMYIGVKEWIDRQIESAKKNGYVETLLGRKRWLPNISSDKGRAKEFEERVAINAPLQGTAADMIKIAMIRIQPQLAKFNANIIIQVHDELVLEVPKDTVKPVKSLVKKEMENALSIGVPIEVKISTGDNWYSAHS